MTSSSICYGLPNLVVKNKMVYKAEFIEGTAVKTLWLELELCTAFKEQVRIIDVTALGAEAIGYMSVMRRLHLQGSERVPTAVVLKTPSPEGGLKAVEAAGGKVDDDRGGVLQESFHDCECDTLSALSAGDHAVKIPKVYYTGKSHTESPCIVMEEIENCHVHPLIPGFDETQLYTITDQIVELQYWSLNNDSWKHPLSPAQIKLAQDCTGMLLSMSEVFFKKHKDFFGDLGDRMIENTLKAEDNYPYWFRTFYENGERPTVLVHGDMWTANFLWKNGTLGAIVDWQLAHKGNVVEDLIHMLSTCTTTAIRRKLTSSLLNHYYNLLKAKNHGKLPFSREQLEEEYKFYLPVGCVWATFATAFWENSILNTETKKQEALDRLKSFLEDTAAILNW